MEIMRPRSLWGRLPYGAEQSHMASAGMDISRAAFLIAPERMDVLATPHEKELTLKIMGEILRTGKKMGHEFKAMTAKKYLSRAIQALDNIGV